MSCLLDFVVDGELAYTMIVVLENIILNTHPSKPVQTLPSNGLLFFSPCANLIQEKIRLLEANRREDTIAAKGNAGNRNHVGCVYCF